MDFLFYNADGRVVMDLHAPTEKVAELDGRLYVACPPGGTGKTYYVDLSGDEPVAKERLPLDTEHQVSGLSVVFPNLPSGTHADIDVFQAESDEDGLEIAFDTPGTYVVELYPPPLYTDEALEVTVG